MTPAPLHGMDQRRLDDFRSFYNVLIELRDRVRASSGDPATATTRLGLTVEALQQRLREKLAELGYEGEGAREGVVHAGYVIVAMADEVMLMDCGDWRGRDGWTDRPLERAVYGTRLAGERVFSAAERLVSGLRDETGTAILILACILLGYRGRYRAPTAANDEKIEGFRKELYKHVYGQAWSAAQSSTLGEISPGPLRGRSTRRLPSLWPWLAAIAALIIAYVPISHILWSWEVRKVAALAKIIVGDESETRGGP